MPSNTSILLSAAPLLSHIVQLPNRVGNIKLLRTETLMLLLRFQSCLLKARINQRVILALRYCLSAAIDEKVLEEGGKAAQAWSKQTLLSILYNDNLGGERVFEIVYFYLNRDCNSQEIQILQLFHILAQLGFSGKLYNDSLAKQRLLNHITQTLNQIVVSNKGTLNQEKSTFQLLKYYLMSFTTIVSVTFIGMNASLYHIFKVIHENI